MDSEVSAPRPRPRIAPGAGSVNNELEVGFDADFENRWSTFERVGRIVLLLIVIAAFTGFLGAGPFDHATAGTVASGGSVDYEPIARFGTTTQTTIHLPPGVATVRIDSGFIEPLGLTTILPQPLEARPDGGGTRLVFALDDPGRPNLIRLSGKPSQVGPISIKVVFGNGVVRRWREFVLP